MDYENQLKKLIDNYGGLVLASDVKKSGIPTQYLTRAVRKGELVRAATGVYLRLGEWDDETYRLQATYSKLVFSHETALFYH